MKQYKRWMHYSLNEIYEWITNRTVTTNTSKINNPSILQVTGNSYIDLDLLAIPIMTCLSTIPAIIMILAIIVAFPICQVVFFIVHHQITQSKTIMGAYKIDTVPWFPSPFLIKRNPVPARTVKG